MENINPNLCTHAAFGFAGLDRNTFNIRVLDPYNELEENWGKGAFNRFTDMKISNPDLKTFISVGGWNEGTSVVNQKVKVLKVTKRFDHFRCNGLFSDGKGSF